MYKASCELGYMEKYMLFNKYSEDTMPATKWMHRSGKSVNAA